MKRLPMYNDQFTALNKRLEKCNEEQVLDARYVLSAAICYAGHEDLMKLMISDQLPDKETEIQFFKEVKPVFESKWLYYKDLYRLYKYRPGLDERDFEKRLKKLIRRVKKFYKRHHHFIAYYLDKRTDADHWYFLRSAYDWRQHCDKDMPGYDSNYCTNGGHILAQLLAYEELKVHLENLRGHAVEQEADHAIDAGCSLNWTAPRAWLVELVYALHASGVFNHGKATVKDIVSTIFGLFNVAPGNVYRCYLELRLRNDRTKFIDRLRADLDNRMNQEDE